jgi:hypothetical protein
MLFLLTSKGEFAPDYQGLANAYQKIPGARLGVFLRHSERLQLSRSRRDLALLPLRAFTQIRFVYPLNI